MIEVIEASAKDCRYWRRGLLYHIARVEEHGTHIVRGVVVGTEMGRVLGAPCTLDGGIEVTVSRCCGETGVGLVTVPLGRGLPS